MEHNSTAIIFDAGIELPTNVMGDNMFVIARAVQIGDEKRRLTREQTAATMLLKAKPGGKCRLLPLNGHDVRIALEEAQASYSSALVVQSNSADMQTRQSLKMATRSVYGDAARIISVETESVALVAALQLITQSAAYLDPEELAQLLAKLLSRMPTWFYAPSGAGMSLFGGGRFVLDQAQIDGKPDPHRRTVTTQSQFVNLLVDTVQSHGIQGKTVYLRHAGCSDLVAAVKKGFGNQGTVKSAETNSVALTSRFGDQVVEIVLMEPTQALIDLTNYAINQKHT